MPPEPLVSVVIPAYNAERFLAEAIESVLAQSRSPDEVIVMDDGSTDSTATVASRYEGVVSLCRQPNRGAGAARNAGIELARGDHIALMDADDRWDARKLERQLACFEADPLLDIVFGHVMLFSTGADGRPRVLSGPRPAPLPATMVARREALRRVGPLPEDVVVSEFLIWLARARWLGLQETMVPEVVAWRRMHEANHGFVNRRAQREYPRVFKRLLDERRRGRSRSAPQ